MSRDVKREKIKLDQMMKVLFKLSKKVMVNLLNALFDEDYDYKKVSIEYSNTEFVDDEFERLYGDIFITVRTENKSFSYHIEFQTLNDNSMAIRMFRYGFEKAVERAGDENNEEITLYYPKQLVIFLEENKNVKDELYFKLRLPDGQEIRFSVPVLKYWKYSAEDLMNKKMYALLPLQVFKSRKKIKTIYDNENITHEDKGKLIHIEFKKLIEVIKTTINVLGELYSSHEIIGTDLEKILRVLTNISEYLYNKYGEYGNIGKEVDIMVTTLYNPVVAEKAKREGIEEGIEKGIEKGREEERKDLALKMLKENVDVNLIEKITGLKSEEIIKLKEKIRKQSQ